jgi:hypothetical protein
MRLLAVGLIVGTAGALAGAQPAAAATSLKISAVSAAAEHVDTTAGPVVVPLSWTVTGIDPTAYEISGSYTFRQYVGTTAVGPAVVVPYDVSRSFPDASYVVHASIELPRFGSAAEASWRFVKLTARDTMGHEAALGAAAIGVRIGVTQLVDAAAPVLDGVDLPPWQSADIVDTGSGATVEFFLTVTDLQAGIWKGRVVLGGPGGARATGTFAVASDGRHLTCGSGSLIDDVYDHVPCSVTVDVPAGAPPGTWSVVRVGLTDNANNTRRYARPAGPVVHLTRGSARIG